jgi:GT2 family glycosyltransferase
MRNSGKLSIIIVNWNSVKYLRACLRSVYREAIGLPMEIIVVDNASNDGCPDMLRTEFPEVHVIAAVENLGFARANNLGYRHSVGDVLLFLNPDTEVIGDSLQQMVDKIRSESRIGAVGPCLLNTDGSVQLSSVQAFPTITNQVLDFDFLRQRFPRWKIFGMAPLLPDAPSPSEADAISGACFMVRRDVFENAGLFGEEYFMYSDDLDLSHRIRQAGYSVICMNKSLVTHHGGKSSEAQNDYFSDVMQRESMSQFLLATRGRLYTMAYRGAMLLVAMFRLIAVGCLTPVRKSALGGKAPRAVFGKWVAILRWAIGLDRSLLQRSGVPSMVAK